MRAYKVPGDEPPAQATATSAMKGTAEITAVSRPLKAATVAFGLEQVSAETPIDPTHAKNTNKPQRDIFKIWFENTT